MLNWFRRWIFNRQRAIFRFWNGRKWCYVDPMVAYQKLKNHPEFNLERDTVFHDAGHEDATALCLAATRSAFGVVEFDGQTMRGLTETETISLLGTFGAWMDFVKKNTSLPPISLATSEIEPPSCTASSTEPTNSLADSPSTRVESSYAVPAL